VGRTLRFSCWWLRGHRGGCRCASVSWLNSRFRRYEGNSRRIELRPIIDRDFQHWQTVFDLTVNGSVMPDVSRTVPVNALAGGRVIQIAARLGEDVQQGQLLQYP
jgi:hypothetical protein